MPATIATPTKARHVLGNWQPPRPSVLEDFQRAAVAHGVDPAEITADARHVYHRGRVVLERMRVEAQP
jgi:hypothetical protein